jgi:hypothetical protein
MLEVMTEVNEALVMPDLRAKVPDPAMEAAVALESAVTLESAMTLEPAAHAHCAVGAAAAVKAAAAEAAGRSVIGGNERRRTESNRRDGGEHDLTEHRSLSLRAGVVWMFLHGVSRSPRTARSSEREDCVTRGTQ